MNRRNFIQYSGITSLLTTSGIFPIDFPLRGMLTDFNSFEELVGFLVQLNDERVPELIQIQEKNEDSENFGGLCDTWGIFNAGSTAGLITVLTISFTYPKSKYHLDKSLITNIENAAKYLLKVQHSDGTIDLMATNFHSTPDTAFVAEPLCACFSLLQKAEFERKVEILSLLKQFLKRTGEAFIVGGVHTPNHRWVVSMALARLNSLFPDSRYVVRMEQWLQEGIDIDSDGQYEEKSTYIYSPLTNRCLVTIARLAGKAELFEPVRKNLEMTSFYVHPNGEIATEASGRQDQTMVGFMENYYLPLRFMAIHDKNPLFSAMTKMVEKTVPEKLGGFLVYLLESDFYNNELPAPSALPDSYIKEFPVSKLARIRRGNTDATILASNPSFFTLTKGNAVLAGIRMAAAFFGRGQFKANKVEKSGDTFVLNWTFTWGYFQPFDNEQKPNYSIPFDEDRKRRRSSERQTLNAVVTIVETNGNFELDFNVDGTNNVPLAVELIFRKGGKFSGVKGVKDTAESYLLGNENATYCAGNDCITFGPGNSEHSWTSIRGGLPKPDAPCVYITGFTPFSRKIRIS